MLKLYYYDGGTKHKMIIDKKLFYLFGNGFEDILDPKLKQFIEDNDLVEHTKKAFFDYEIINAFSFGISWDLAGENIATIERQPVFKLGTPNLILQIRSKEDRSSKLMWLIGDIFYNTRRINYYWIEEVNKVDEDLENMKVNLKIG